MSLKLQSLNVRCINISCGLLINREDIIEHLKSFHPNFYKQAQKAIEAGEEVNFNKFFMEAN